MSSTLRRTFSVLLVTAATAAAVWGGVALSESSGSTGTLSNTTAATTASSTTLTCPRTGCTATTCHAASGSSGTNTVGGRGEPPGGVRFQ